MILGGMMRWVIFSAALMTASVLASPAWAASDDCKTKNYSFESYDNATVDVEMTVKAGKLCGITLGDPDGYVHGTVISRQPAHGAAAARGLYVAYRSAPNYRGADRFTYVRDVTTQFGERVKRTVNVLITVVP